MIGIYKLIVLTCVLLMASILNSQETESDLDALFEAPQTDVIEDSSPEEAPIDHTAAFTVQERLGVSGNFTATGGIGLGYEEYSGLRQPWSDLDGSFLAQSSMALYMEARPDPDLRVHGGFSVSLEPSTGNYSWSSIAVDELFCDYTLLEAAFIRFGKHTVAWGQGRLYTPGDLMDGSENGTAFRVTFPTVLSGVSFVTLAQNDYFTDPANPSVTEFAYGGLADMVFGRVRTSVGIRYRKPEGYQALGSLKTTLVGTDVFCDVVGRYNAEKTVNSTVLSGFYREWKDLTIYGEWQYDRSSDAASNAVGAALAYKNVGGTGFDLGAKWLHAMDPSSGAIALGLSWDPFKYVKTSVAIPVVYGSLGRYDILDEDMPLTQRVSLVLLAKITTSF